jgi:hypothetical protein
MLIRCHHSWISCPVSSSSEMASLSDVELDVSVLNEPVDSAVMCTPELARVLFMLLPAVAADVGAVLPAIARRGLVIVMPKLPSLLGPSFRLRNNVGLISMLRDISVSCRCGDLTTNVSQRCAWVNARKNAEHRRERVRLRAWTSKPIGCRFLGKKRKNLFLYSLQRLLDICFYFFACELLLPCVYVCFLLTLRYTRTPIPLFQSLPGRSPV